MLERIPLKNVIRRILSGVFCGLNTCAIIRKKYLPYPTVPVWEKSNVFFVSNSAQSQIKVVLVVSAQAAMQLIVDTDQNIKPQSI